MTRYSYYFHTNMETVRESKEQLRLRFGLVPPNEPDCNLNKLVFENTKGLGIYRIDFCENPALVIFRYWDQRYVPERDKTPMEDAIKFFTKNYQYSRITDSLLRDIKIEFD